MHYYLDFRVVTSVTAGWHQSRAIEVGALTDFNALGVDPGAATATPPRSSGNSVFHAAGLRGLGGSSYIDSVVCRDKDANSRWTNASDGTLEERRYYCQNWRSDVVCITDSTGDPQEWIRYSAYGVPFSIPKGDYNCDGVLDSNDTAAFTGMVAGSPGFWTDFNQDGNVDTGDTSSLTAYITANSSAPGGRGKLSRGDGTTSASSLGNRLGYAGYQFDPALSGSVWHVRNRVLVSELGRWTRRDPIGSLGGPNLLSYCRSSPIRSVDPEGLIAFPCVKWESYFDPTTSLPTGMTPADAFSGSSLGVYAGHLDLSFSASLQAHVTQSSIDWYIRSTTVIAAAPGTLVYPHSQSIPGYTMSCKKDKIHASGSSGANGVFNDPLIWNTYPIPRSDLLYDVTTVLGGVGSSPIYRFQDTTVEIWLDWRAVLNGRWAIQPGITVGAAGLGWLLPGTNIDSGQRHIGPWTFYCGCCAVYDPSTRNIIDGCRGGSSITFPVAPESPYP